jgi:hypothetical protein
MRFADQAGSPGMTAYFVYDITNSCTHSITRTFSGYALRECSPLEAINALREMANWIETQNAIGVEG